MKTTDLKTAAELLGMAAIVASLILVAYEVRQANLQAEAAAIHARYAQIEGSNSAMALSPDLAEIYFKATTDGVETLTPIEKFRLTRWERARQWRMISQIAQYELGFLNRDDIENTVYAITLRERGLWADLGISPVSGRYANEIKTIREEMELGDQ